VNLEFVTNNIAIYSITSGPVDTNAYIIVCKHSSDAAVIDPAQDSHEEIIQTAQDHGVTIKKIIITHSHWDHICDAKILKNLVQAPILIHEKDAYNLIHPGSDGVPLWVKMEGVNPDILLKDNDIIEVGKSLWKVIHTPGHSHGSICLFDEKDRILISGDTLFKRSIGRLDLPTSSPQTMWPSLKKLDNLPKETIVFPGHGPTTTIGSETWLKDAEKYWGI
jgi:hydroxyacylglutathione hydrolase